MNLPQTIVEKKESFSRWVYLNFQLEKQAKEEGINSVRGREIALLSELEINADELVFRYLSRPACWFSIENPRKPVLRDESGYPGKV